MTVQLSTKTERRLQGLSKTLHIDKKKLLERAVDYYSNAIEKERELKKELKNWDKLSNEAFITFEKNI